MFLNLHSHKNLKPEGGQVILNVIIQPADEAKPVQNEVFPGQLISAGIHPWYISERDYQSQIGALIGMASSREVKMIGECGLDRLRGPDIELQKRVFCDQVGLAERLRKPVLIHCVRCLNELLQIRKQLNPTVPLIVHGFNSKPEIARQLIQAGFHLSFGAALLNELSNAAKVIKELPADRFFLETDDSDIPIEPIYEQAALLRNVSLSSLKEIIFANYLRLVGDQKIL